MQINDKKNYFHIVLKIKTKILLPNRCLSICHELFLIKESLQINGHLDLTSKMENMVTI